MREADLFLTGDIGGTKTALAVVSTTIGPREPVVTETFVSTEYPDLESVAAPFLAQVGLSVGHACFGVAGPVAGERADITNLPWRIDARRLAATLRIPRVRLINDLAATAQAIPFLVPSDLMPLSRGQGDPRGAMAVIAPGTGLGEAFLTRTHAGWQVHGSEGGHADFSPISVVEVELLRHLQTRFEHVSFEHLCSGRGLANIYGFFKTSGIYPEPDWLTAALEAAADPAPVIVASALDLEKECPICTATLELFATILAAEAGNLCLKVLATGGVFLAGGILPRILPLLQTPRFLETFRSKGKMTALLGRVPLQIITNPRAALLGAAYYGMDAERAGAE
ncbi:MAG: glucokinase [Desulfobacterales bacterium]|nr:glucokinase [Desulfobacterales bacterium]